MIDRNDKMPGNYVFLYAGETERKRERVAKLYEKRVRRPKRTNDGDDNVLLEKSNASSTEILNVYPSIKLTKGCCERNEVCG